jgi:hypothetical protein
MLHLCNTYNAYIQNDFNINYILVIIKLVYPEA